MTSRDHTRTLARIATATTDVCALKRILDNTVKLYGLHDEVVVAVRKRIKERCGPIGVIEDEYMDMRKATIEVVGRAPRLKALIDSRGVLRALVYLMEKPPSAAYRRLMAKGRSCDTAEAIVDRHADYFPASTVAMARARLSERNHTFRRLPGAATHCPPLVADTD